MGDCPNAFGQMGFLPLSPKLVDADTTPPSSNIRVTLDVAMDQTVSPVTGVFEVVRDGVPETPLLFTWFDAFNFDLVTTGTMGALIVVNLLNFDVNFRSLTGVIVTAPQSVIAFP